MKKLSVIFLAALLAISLAACGGDGQPGEAAKARPLELLNAVWDSYSDEEKFPGAGGDMENTNMEGPGTFSIEDAAALDATLGLPEASADKIEEAASLVHMMNANTFTCGAFRLKSGETADSLAGDIKENLTQRQWMCGFPDKLVIMEADGCLVSFFGSGEIVDGFKAKLTGVCASAKTLCDEPIA